jgi:MoxR-like ATPase
MEQSEHKLPGDATQQTNMGFSPRTNLQPVHELTAAIKTAASTIIVGQDETIELLLAAMLAGGHVLIEGVPGVAKTLMAKTLARLIDAGFSRIQFTPDLMPSDVTGASIFHPREAQFQFRKGPVFSNIVLIDEVNRAPAKTQAALFEVMEEQQVTVDGQTYSLEQPFLIIATQNPVEYEGTYRLPEAQLDRFLFKIKVPYPSLEEETRILLDYQDNKGKILLQHLLPVIDKTQLLHCRALVQQVHVEPRLVELIARISHTSRSDKALYLGASPRASLALLQAAKALAVLRGRDFVTPEDILYMAPPVLRHRISLTPEREMDGTTPDEVIQDLLTQQEIPR